MATYKLWKHKDNRKLLKKNGRIMACWVCPCCKPKVIAQYITNRSTGPTTWSLSPYTGDRIGLPGAMWRLRDVGESHYYNSSEGCSGVQYGEGLINENGKLVGLPSSFTSTYDYNGYMQIQQGCVREDGSIEWPC